MSNIGRRGARSGEYSVIYSDMRGVDLRGDGSSVDRHRFADLENMYKDYEGGGEGAIESIPGYRRLLDLGDKIHGIFAYKNETGAYTVCIHSGEKLAAFPLSSVSGEPTVTYYSGIAKRDSAAYSSKGALYILDGEKIFRLSANGCSQIKSAADGIYIPTLYKNGTEYEQINLLCDDFYESFTVGSAASVAYGSPELKYTVTDDENKKCAIIGMEGTAENLFIPSRALIGGEEYKVCEISDYAFRGKSSIKSVFISDGLTRVGFLSFDGCSALETVILPETLITVAEGAFGGCVELKRVHLGSSLKEISTLAFNLCSSLERVTFSRDRSVFEAISGKGYVPAEVEYNSQNTECYARISLHAPAVSITKVTIDGAETSAYTTVSEGGLIRGILFHFANREAIEGKEVKILAKLSKKRSDHTAKGQSFLGGAYRDDGDVYSVIGGCTVAEAFDGRIFLTGNPKYPGYTFYSSFGATGENEPLYFGALNYFLDGEGSFGNTALLATSDALAIFKATDGGGGGIFYRAPKETGIDLLTKIYPLVSSHTGICAVGGAISFFDDPVFISNKGVCAITKKTLDLERSIAVRSTNVNPSLLSEDISSSSLAVWQGYLCICTGGNIYLADSRDRYGTSEGFEYEWYILKGVGSYKNSKRLYRYKSEATDGFLAKEGFADKKAEATVVSVGQNGKTVLYTNEDGALYEVYATEEMEGGTFYPAKHLLSVEGRLLFGTDDGSVMIFNNDKRGMPPPGGTDEEAPPKNRLHPYYYSFDRHAPRYALKCAKDSCSMPHLSKNTVKHSLTVKLRAQGTGCFTAEVFCDTRGYRELCKFPSGRVSFSDMNFSSLTMQTEDTYTAPLSEREKRWVEKQIAIYTDEYSSPFGIYAIAYRFTVDGKIKKNR
jgi:hypothetical protein